METFIAVQDKDTNAVFAFEVENAYFSLATVAELLTSVSGVRDLQRRKWFGEWDDVHIKFKYLARDFVVTEPFGDNSRYWIGPQEPDKEKVDISTIERCFREYQLPICRKLFGDALSLRFVGRLLNVISGNRARRNSS